MDYKILFRSAVCAFFQAQFAQGAYGARTEWGCFFGEKGACNCNVRTDAGISNAFGSSTLKAFRPVHSSKLHHLFPRLSLGNSALGHGSP